MKVEPGLSGSSKPISAARNSTAARSVLPRLLLQVRNCDACAGRLPLGPRPVLQIGESARLLIIGQAPGSRAHASGIPWSDRSGDELPRWLDLPAEVFYDSSCVAILPMGFCYPGRGVSGDLPPRHECAGLWHHRLLAQMPGISLTLLVGRYAQRRYLGPDSVGLTAAMQSWRARAPGVMLLPHPSPRNRGWFARNPWFEAELLALLRERVRRLGLRLQGDQSASEALEVGGGGGLVAAGDGR